MVCGTNSFHEPLHASDSTACSTTTDSPKALVRGSYLVGGRRLTPTIRGRDARFFGAVLRTYWTALQDPQSKACDPACAIGDRQIAPFTVSDTWIGIYDAELGHLRGRGVRRNG
jgi:hypothetical protein